MERLKLARSHRYNYILYASIPSPSQALGDRFRAALENTPDLSGGKTYVIMRGRKGGHVAKGSFNLLGTRPVWVRLIYFAVKFQGMRSSMRLVLWSCRRSSTQVSHASGLTPFMRAVSIKV